MTRRSAPDGILCFGGEDWWYHNRGHFDLQMMREASKVLPVLYVNSIGVRSPNLREGKMFGVRLLRKAASMMKGLVRISASFAVYSPFTSPKLRRTRFGLRLAAIQIKHALSRFGIKNPIIWAAIPSAAEFLDHLSFHSVLYQRTDRFEDFDPLSRDRVCRQDVDLKHEAALVLYASRHLMQSDGVSPLKALFVDHGVDDQFFRADETLDDSENLNDLPRPVIGFVGGVDDHTFDKELYLGVVRRMPTFSFLIVGSVSLEKDWCAFPNVRQLGQKPYESIPGYMAHCDVLIMPWRDNDWIRACNPVKLKEYLAVSRPVVSTPFPELVYYDGCVKIASGEQDFAAAIRECVNHPVDQCRERVRNHRWRDKFEMVWDRLTELGVTKGVDT